jgi:hypothetical protein
MSMKSVIAAAALLSLAGAASAVTIDWGVHAPAESNSPTATPGLFTDVYTFSVLGQNVIAGVAVANNVVVTPFPNFNITVYNIAGGLFSLWEDNGSPGMGGGDVKIGGDWMFDGTTGSTSHSMALNTGSYFYMVTGNATGTSGGLYTIASALAPVPEPETYALMLAGLGAIGFMAARRRPRV